MITLNVIAEAIVDEASGLPPIDRERAMLARETALWIELAIWNQAYRAKLKDYKARTPKQWRLKS